MSKFTGRPTRRSGYRSTPTPRARGIGIDQVAAAVRSSNVNLATGTLDGPARSSVIQAEGQLTKAADYLPQIIAYRDGAPVRFSDVGTVIDSVENRWLSGRYNGRQGVTLGINRQPGANTIAVVDAIKAILPNLRAQLPPSVRSISRWTAASRSALR